MSWWAIDPRACQSVSGLRDVNLRHLRLRAHLAMVPLSASKDGVEVPISRRNSKLSNNNATASALALRTTPEQLA